MTLLEDRHEPVTADDPVVPKPGDTLSLRLVGASLAAAVVAVDGVRLDVETDHALVEGSGVWTRYVDPARGAYETRAEVMEVRPDGSAVLELLAPFAPAPTRRAHRRLLRGERLRCLAYPAAYEVFGIDVSSTGLRAAVHGRQPPRPGDRVRIVGLRVQPVAAVVVRVQRSAFGRHEVAFRLED